MDFQTKIIQLDKLECLIIFMIINKNQDIKKRTKIYYRGIQINNLFTKNPNSKNKPNLNR